MKQKIFLFLALALLLFIAGCTQQNLSVEDSISADENLIKIGVSQIGAESDWRVANSESIKTVFTEAHSGNWLGFCPFGSETSPYSSDLSRPDDSSRR